MLKNHRSQIKRIWREIRLAALGLIWLISLFMGYLGFTIYAHQNQLPYSILDRIYLSLQLISMNSGAVEGNVNWALEIARYLVPALTVFTAFQAIINLFQEQTQWWHLWFIRNHVILCGLGRKGSYLIDDLLSEGFQLVVIEKRIDPAAANENRRKGVIIIEGDATDAETLQKARLSRASHLICLLGDDQQNLRIALQAYHLVEGKDKNKTLTCIIHLISEDLFDLVKKSELRINKDDPFILEIFNTYKRTAIQLVDRFTGQQNLTKKFVVVGMGRLGKNLIVQSAQRFYSENNSGKVDIIVLDKDASAIVKKLYQDFPHLSSVCNVSPIDLDLNISQLLKDTFVEQFKNESIDQVFICMGNPILAIQISLALLELSNLSGVPFHIRLEKSSGLFDLLEDLVGAQSNHALIHPFDMYQQTCTSNLVIGGIHELLAIKLRHNYLENLSTPDASRQLEIPWEAVSEWEKDANRQQASRICQLLQAFGYIINPLRNWDAGELTFDQEEVIGMAKMEHALWAQWKRKTGWKFGEKRDQQKKTNPDLCPWEDLSEEERNKNEVFIRNLPGILAELGFQIDKID